MQPEPEESDIEIKVLEYRKAKEYQWPALAKMVKQYFAAPASSAGVERVFSAAGKMHGDLQKSAKDSTLEHSLFAAFNTDYTLERMRQRRERGETRKGWVCGVGGVVMCEPRDGRRGDGSRDHGSQLYSRGTRGGQRPVS